MPEWRLPGSWDVVVERDLPAAMPDGVRLFADVYRPAAGGPFPVLLLRTPYDKTFAQTSGYRHPSFYASHGYLVVAQDVRGRHRSEGDFYPWANEATDGAETIEWAAALPHSNGRVGTYGFSYPGAVQLLAATLRPPSLVTVAPGFTSSRYHEGWTYRGGALQLAFVVSWAVGLAAEDAHRRGDDRALRELNDAFANGPSLYGHLPLAEYPPLVAHADLAPYFFDWLAHPSYDDYWRRWSIDEDYSRIDVPALHQVGWYDVFLAGCVRNFDGLRSDAGSPPARAGQKLVVGPWYHAPWSSRSGVMNLGPQARTTVDDWHLRWFAQFLREEDTGVLDAPATVFVMGEDRWVDLPAWPPDGAERRELFLRSGGRANTADGDGRLSDEGPDHEPPDVFVYDPLSPTPSAGGRSCCNPTVTPMGPADQAAVEMLNRVLVYSTEPLPRDLLVMGDVEAVIHVGTDAADTDITVKLCDVGADGRSVNVAEGIARARFRVSASDPEPITPGEVVAFQVDLGPTAIRFGAGHRVRVQVSSSDFPQFDTNLNTGGVLFREGPASARMATQVILHDRDHPSRITLPVVED